MKIMYKYYKTRYMNLGIDAELIWENQGDFMDQYYIILYLY